MSTELLDSLRSIAAQAPPSVIFPEATDAKIIQAARKSCDLGIIRPILFGNEAEIREAAASCEVSLNGISLMSPDDETRARYAAKMAEKTGLSEKSALRKLNKPLFYCLMAVECDDADTLMAGIRYTTAELVAAAMMTLGLKEGISTVSSALLLEVPGWEGAEGPYVCMGDCAVCIDPDSEQLADIAIGAADMVTDVLGWDPRVALLSFSTKGSNDHEMVTKVRQAVDIARAKRPDLKVDGEFQLDSAISPEVASRKVKVDSDVAGRANVLVFPDINAANIGAKLVQHYAKGVMYCPTLEGVARPVVDLSRGASVDDVVGSLTMLAVRTIRYLERREQIG